MHGVTITHEMKVEKLLDRLSIKDDAHSIRRERLNWFGRICGRNIGRNRLSEGQSIKTEEREVKKRHEDWSIKA